MSNGYIAVDLDGTLAYYDEWKGAGIIGDPIVPMIKRVKRWLSEGKDVKIFTARVSGEDAVTERMAIERWSMKHIGQVLDVICCKDYRMVELWDDRAIQICKNTGMRVDGVQESNEESGDISDVM